MNTEAIVDPCSLARSAELLAGTGADHAATLLDRLATELRSRSRRGQLHDSLVESASMIDGLARRLRGGHVKSLSGLERHVRLLLGATATDGHRSHGCS